MNQPTILIIKDDENIRGFAKRPHTIVPIEPIVMPLLCHPCPDKTVLPADKLMEIQDGSLHLVPRPPTGANNAIDHFLFSLADDRAYGSIGIVLSGEGSDGAEGIKILKEESGGVTMAQTPASAASESMPTNAIQIDHVDHILTPKDIARQLASMSWRDSNIKNTPLKVLWVGGHETASV